MNKITIKMILSLSVLTVALPAFANVTTLTINATVEPILSVRLERVSDSVIVSGDNKDSVFFIGTNDVLKFVTVTPSGTGTNTLVSSRSSNGTIYPVSFAIHVPFTRLSGATTTILTFTGT